MSGMMSFFYFLHNNFRYNYRDWRTHWGSSYLRLHCGVQTAVLCADARRSFRPFASVAEAGPHQKQPHTVILNTGKLMLIHGMMETTYSNSMYIQFPLVNLSSIQLV